MTRSCRWYTRAVGIYVDSVNEVAARFAEGVLYLFAPPLWLSPSPGIAQH
jgi:hypothetical protein